MSVRRRFSFHKMCSDDPGTYLKTKSAKDALEAAVNTLYGLVSHMDSGALDLPLIDEQRQILSPEHRFEAVRC